MFLFDEATIGRVLGAFAEEAQAHWGDSCGSRDIWAVASRHSRVGKKGAWQPKSLVDYHPGYRNELKARAKTYLLCPQLQKASICHATMRPPAEVADFLASSVASLARGYEWTTASSKPITSQNLWEALAYRDPSLPRKVRRLLRDHVLCGSAVWEEAAWGAFLQELLPLFGNAPEGAADKVVDLCAFVLEQTSSAADPGHRSNKQVQFGDTTLCLGSIHSVKGKTVDGILVVESEVWKGTAAKDQCIDLTTVLPRAFGLTNQVFTGVALTAATNVFVGVTRPRELLGLALRKSSAMDLIKPAQDQGWKIVDLTIGA